MARTKKGTPPAYQLHAPSGRAKVVIAGQTIYLGRHGTPESHDAYAKAIAQWKATQANPEHVVVSPRDGITICELSVAYTQWAEGYYVKAGQQTSEVFALKAAIRILLARYETLPVAEFSPRCMLQIIDDMCDQKQRGDKDAAGWARNSINKHIVRLKSMFKWGVARGFVPTDIHLALTCVGGIHKGRATDSGRRARETAPVPPVADEIIDATIIHLPQVVADMIRLQRLTAMRPEELCSLSPSQIDRSKPVWVYRPATFKSEHHEDLAARAIPIGPRAQVILAPYLLRAPSSPCFNPREAIAQRRSEDATGARHESSAPTPRKSARTVRDHYDADSYRKAVQRAATDARLPSWFPNQIRHTRATELAELYGTEAAQVTCGHAHLDTTEIYAEKSLKKACEIAAIAG